MKKRKEMTSIKTPTLLLDSTKCKQNISDMVKKANEHKVAFRPHFKTHQSLEIARWFKKKGVEKTTVSSVSMAQYFARDWDDILIAFPVNLREIDKINKLSQNKQLHLLIESTETVKFLSEKLTNKVGFFIKIDTGSHRTGLNPDDYATIDAILKQAATSDKLQFTGFLSHAGHTYHVLSKAEVLEIHAKECKAMLQLKEHYKITYPDCIVSIGDTPSCSISDNFQEVDEIRPGNFVFYDLMQMNIGSCVADQIAVAMACPIVAIHKNRNEMVIYGGGVHFSKDAIQIDGQTIYGQAVETTDAQWGKPIPGMVVKRLSQEHGIIHLPDEQIKNFNIGDLVYILPVHSCMTADIYDEYLTLDGKTISKKTIGN